ncbi:MAG: diaminopimelate decarboxylase [Chitinispirillales bacterium]|jgi:diaminopimelate decarboxylase|nr:diaminopimelate decarboxylase [Chitinispirillales bacterium]
MEFLDNSVSLKDDGFYIDDVSLNTIIKEYAAPLFIYDGNYIEKKYLSLYKHIPWKKLKIFYAMKANYNVSILKMLKEKNASLDTVSPAEVLLSSKLGYPPENVIFTANNMTDQEMDEVKKSGVLFNIDSLSRLEKYGKKYPDTDICIRFNPDVIAGENSKVQTGGESTKFGVLLSEVENIKKIVEKYGLAVKGLHEHTGSGISETESVYQSMRNLLSIAKRENFPNLEFISFGGGFKVPYTPEDKKIDYSEFGKNITNIFSSFCKEYGKELYLCFEPGKYVVAEGGYFVVQVNTIKNNRGRMIVGTNSGFPHLIRPVLYNAYHHICNISNPRGKMFTYDICGNICETGDLFASQRQLPEVREGDFLLIMNAGAYCYSMGSIYNLRPLPNEVFIYNGRANLSTKMLSSNDFVENILRGHCG